jgi:dephospho-CoA kinase
MKCLIISGPPGAGKSTLGKMLARKWGWCFLEKDKVYPLPGRFVGQGTESQEYQKTVRPVIYKRLAEEVSGRLLRENVIVEAPLLHEFRSGTREGDFVSVFPNDCQYLLVWVTCEREVQYKRRINRADRQDRHLFRRSWAEYVEQTKDLFTTPSGVIVINNNNNQLSGLQKTALQLDRWAND